MPWQGWNTLSTFALPSSWAPGAGDDTAFITHVVTPIMKRADHADLPKLRKLYHEAYTVVAAELRQRLEGAQEADGDQDEEAAAGGAENPLGSVASQLWPPADQ